MKSLLNNFFCIIFIWVSIFQVNIQSVKAIEQIEAFPLIQVNVENENEHSLQNILNNPKDFLNNFESHHDSMNCSGNAKNCFVNSFKKTMFIFASSFLLGLAYLTSTGVIFISNFVSSFGKSYWEQGFQSFASSIILTIVFSLLSPIMLRITSRLFQQTFLFTNIRNLKSATGRVGNNLLERTWEITNTFYSENAQMTRDATAAMVSSSNIFINALSESSNDLEKIRIITELGYYLITNFRDITDENQGQKKTVDSLGVLINTITKRTPFNKSLFDAPLFSTKICIENIINNLIENNVDPKIYNSDLLEQISHKPDIGPHAKEIVSIVLRLTINQINKNELNQNYISGEIN